MAFSKREAPNCDWCQFRKNCLYELLGTKESKKAWREMRVANPFKSGEVIFHEGTTPMGVYVVCTGRVKIYKSSRSGQQLITRIEHPGDLLGHITLLHGGPYDASGEAMETSVVSLVDAQSFTGFLTKYPNASLALLKALAHDVKMADNKARDVAFKPARSRLADVLCRLKKPGKAHPIVADMKRRDLAEMAGLSIETTVRLLKDFEERELLEKKEKALILLNESQLLVLAGLTS
ncbi:MAG: Crp/Fnr family transcriptional regulator [Elusimicrobia bacterium]|nr:Crp/Fnr family transcriptional regulator [Elusimicrobiota bacterium]